MRQLLRWVWQDPSKTNNLSNNSFKVLDRMTFLGELPVGVVLLLEVEGLVLLSRQEEQRQ